ncbi:MAG: hypothetical protein HOW73_20650 [Polyangiaceae bacterium]|nr:hypothetical protein [Polyangiaceae bacterium]
MNRLALNAMVGSVVVGCNAIFGITEGTLDDAGGGGATSNGGAGGSDAQGAGAAGGGGASEDGGAGGEGGTPVESVCDPGGLATGQAIADECGVFVDVDAPDNGDGTKTSPFNAIGRTEPAVLEGKAIYVCGSPTFNGVFHWNAGIRLYGGLECGAWTFESSNLPTLAGTNNEFALSIEGQGESSVSWFRILGPQADGQVTPGFAHSSIGVVVSKGSVSLDHVRIETMPAQKGPDGAPHIDVATPGPGGQSATQNCMAALAGGQLVCGSANVSGGGGAPCNSTANQPGQMGFGSSPGGGGSYGSSCIAAGEGSAGSAGGPGPQGIADGGMLSTHGYEPALAGGNGDQGAPGSGGGGGGARFGNTGGGGGAGGCGGLGGRGGFGGGASIAVVVVFQGNVSLTASALFPGRGGDGGRGSDGQAGGMGGPRGSGLSPGFGCDGAMGGPGGRGGPGGGGGGGPTAFIARDPSSIVTVDAATLADSNPNSSGHGGDGGSMGLGNVGQTGLSCDELVLSGNPDEAECIQH